MARSIDTISDIESKTTTCLTTSHTKKLFAFALLGKAARTTQQRAGVHQSQIRLDCAQEFVQQSW